jgi:hypothetical protein
VINFKTLAIAAVLSSVAFAMPSSSQAMPQAAPVKIDAASNGSLVQVYYRYCQYGRCYAQYHRYGHYHKYQRSYYDNCRPCYGYYRPEASSYRRSYGYPSFYRYYERPCFGPGPRLYFGY